MLETSVEGTARITVGRIAYCVVAAFPLLTFLHSVFHPGQTKDERFRDFLLGILQISLNVLVVVVGIGVLLWKRAKDKPLKFWVAAVLVSGIPLIF